MSIAHLFGMGSSVSEYHRKVIRQFYDDMRACVWNDEGVCSEWFEVVQGLRQECVLFPLLFNVLFPAVLLVALGRFSEDADIFNDLAHLQEQPSKVSPEMALECVQSELEVCRSLTTRASCSGRPAG